MNKSSHKKSGLRIRFNVNSGPKNGSSRDTSEGGTKAVQTNSYQHQPNFSNPKFEKNYSSSIGPTTTTSNHHINQNSMQITNSNNNIIHSTIVKSNNGSNTIRPNSNSNNVNKTKRQGNPIQKNLSHLRGMDANQHYKASSTSNPTLKQPSQTNIERNGSLKKINRNSLSTNTGINSHNQTLSNKNLVQGLETNLVTKTA